MTPLPPGTPTPEPWPDPERPGVRAPVLDEIAAERRRQVEQEGWSPTHDDGHRMGQMAGAAACYLMYGLRIESEWLRPRVGDIVGDLWPWAKSWWKPQDRRRDLIRAAALIVAEIERLDRRTALAPETAP